MAIQFALAVLLASSVSAATLEKLSLDDMIAKSSDIVQVRVTSAQAVKRGSIIYTDVKVQVEQRWKGAESTTETVTLPGGSLNGVVQHFSGTPELRPTYEYLLFLWRGPSGRAQIIGLSQGMFELQYVDSVLGKSTNVTRAASTETMLDPMTGHVVADEPLELSLSQMSARIKRVLGTGAAK